jgi:hypothetical protein
MDKVRAGQGKTVQAEQVAQAEATPGTAKGVPGLRSAVRFPIKLGIRVLTENGEIQAETEDISSNGMLFISESLPAVDSRVEFTIAMPSAVMGSATDVAVHCIGRVVRHQYAGPVKKAAVVIDEYFLKA